MTFKNDDLSRQVEATTSRRKPRHLMGMGAARRIITETATAIGCIRTLAVYGYSYRYRLALLALLTPARSISPLLTPLIMQLLIDKAYPARNMRLFAWLCAALLGLRVLPNVLSCISGYLSTYVQVLMQYKLSLRVFNAIHRLPQSYREAHDSGVFLERATRDVSAVASSITRLVPEVVTILFTFLAAILLMFRLSMKITLLVLAIVPINYVITVCLSHRLRALQEVIRKTDERITTFTAETIEGATIARMFALGRSRRLKLRQLLRSHLDLTFATWRAGTFWGQLGSAVSIIWGMVLLCGGWYLVFTNRLQLGEAVALSMYVGVLARPFQQLGKLYQSLIQDSVAARRVIEIVNMQQRSRRRGVQRPLTRPPRRLELEKLSFAYKKGRPCLHDLDFQLESGETVALIGPSGAGKSTLIRILSGLDDRYTGQFLVDGREFGGIARDSYLHYISLVPQSTFFFSDTIRDNLCAGDGSVPTEVLRRHSRLLGLEELIDSAPEGYDTKLGSEGIRLSAGQYQKLAALRAVLKNAPILLLDEVTSSMDIESEKQLLKGIVALRSPGCATLLVTHHIAVTTEPWIDNIVVMVNGRVSERGSCAQLREERGFYHHWLTLSKGTPLDHVAITDDL